MFELVAREGISGEWEVMGGRRPGPGTNFDVYT